MGLFGMPPNPLMQPQTQDMFGNASTGGAMPPMAGGMLGAQGAKKPGYNDPGGWAEKLSALGDVLGRAGGMGGTGAAQMLMQARQQRRQAEEARYAPQHLANGIIVHLDRNTGQYVTDYAPPADAPAPGPIERNYTFLKGLDPNLAQQYVQGQANPMIGVDVQGPDGSITRNFYPRSGAPSAAPQGPPPGVTFTPLPDEGGAGSQAPHTFRGLPRPHGRAR